MARRIQFPAPIEVHARRLREAIGLSLRATKIARRTLTLRREHPEWEQLDLPKRRLRMEAQMGKTNAPYWVAEIPLEDLEKLLGVRFDPAANAYTWRESGPEVTDVARELILSAKAGPVLRLLSKGLPLRHEDTSKLERAKAGLPIGRLPFGYRWSRKRVLVTIGGNEREEPIPEPDPDTAWVIEEIYELYMSGLTYTEIARRLNEEEAPSPSGKAWRKETIREIVQNPFYAGRILYRPTKVDEEGRRRYERHEGILFPGQHEGIIRLVEWDAVQKERITRALARRNLASRVKFPRFEVKPPRPSVPLFIAGEQR